MLPWTKVEVKVEKFATAPTVAAAREAFASINALEKMKAMPGAAKKAVALRELFRKTRDEVFASAIEKHDIELARGLYEDFPSEANFDEETVRVAALARDAGASGPSLVHVSISNIPWNLRKEYYAFRHIELANFDPAAAESLLLEWLQLDPAELAPRSLIIRSSLARNDFDSARAHAFETEPAQFSACVESIAGDESLAPATRAHFLLLLNQGSRAIDLLDRMLQENPADEWAAASRASLAEAAGDTSTARRIYSSIVERAPNRADLQRRLGELAEATEDRQEMLERYKAAWSSGDHEAGLRYAAALVGESPETAIEAGRAIESNALDIEGLFSLATLFLDANSNRDAAAVLKKIVTRDRKSVERAIGLAHHRVEAGTDDALSLLDLLIEIAPFRGYNPELYQLMAAQKLAELGEKDRAKEYLKLIRTPEMHWKAEIELVKIMLSEPNAMKELHAKRLEASLPEAEIAGRRTWAELAYHIGLLWESASNSERAASTYETLLSKEFQFRDAVERLQRIREGKTPAAVQPGEDEVEKTVIIAAPIAAAQLQSRYELLDAVGKGGMAEVYRARDRMLDRIVALKLLLNTGDDSQDMMVREARTTAKLNHSNILKIFDIGREQGRWFIAMEFIGGKTLKDILKSGPLPKEAAGKIMLAILDALEAAHAAGVIHRDLKPANIMLRNERLEARDVVLTDFGLARVATDASIVMPGMAAGTAAYMSPEQIRGEKVDARADIYACGCVLYEMLEGKPLFLGSNVTATMFQHLSVEPGTLMSNRILSDNPLSRTLLGFVARDIDLRFSSAAEAAAELRTALESK